MTIREWLHRLDLFSIYPKFKAQKVRRTVDLKFLNEEGDLTTYEMVENENQAIRIWEMISGKDEAKEDFKYLSKHGMRQIILNYIEKEKEITDLVNSIPEDTLTGF